MKRNFKFKIWDEVCKTMITDTNHVKIYLNGSVSIMGTWATSDVTLLQYTGMKDSENIEICEGDIVEYEDEIFEIIFENGGFRMKKWNYLFIQNELKIVGNIYENPELLENHQDDT